MSELVAVIARVIKKEWSYQHHGEMLHLQPLSAQTASVNEMKHCTKHGKVIFFSASLEECPACTQIGNLTFADV